MCHKSYDCLLSGSYNSPPNECYCFEAAFIPEDVIASIVV